MYAKYRREIRAFTLVETIVAMSVLAILFAIGVPVYRNHQASAEVSKAADFLVSDLRLARQWANTAGVPPAFEGPQQAQLPSQSDLVRYEIKDGDTIRKSQEYPGMTIQFTGFSAYSSFTRGLHADFYARPARGAANQYLFSIILHPNGTLQESGTITFRLRNRTSSVSADVNGNIKQTSVSP